MFIFYRNMASRRYNPIKRPSILAGIFEEAKRLRAINKDQTINSNSIKCYQPSNHWTYLKYFF